MPAIGGSLESITLDGRSFAVTADADTGRKLGGYENSIEANGDGTGRLIKAIVMPMLSGVVVEIDDTQNDHEFVQALANSNRFFPATATFASGVTYQWTSQIIGELSFSNQSTTASFDLSGTGTMTPQ